MGRGHEYSEVMAWKIDEEVQSIMDEAYKRALTVLQENRQGLDRVAEALMEKEMITGEMVLELVGREDRKAAMEKAPDFVPHMPVPEAAEKRERREKGPQVVPRAETWKEPG
jgi:cell division protease FtsH